jgi:hypothetical protein
VCRLNDRQVARLPGRAGGRPGRVGLGPGPAVDAGPGRHADRPAVPYPLHPARHLVSAAPPRLCPAGPGAPGRRARQAGDRRVEDHDLGEASGLAAATGVYVCFEDEAGQNLRPPKARTGAPRGHTPVVRVSGKGSGKVSVAGPPVTSPARGPPVLQGPHPHMSIASVGISNRRYTGDRRSPKPSGRITQDTRVILARVSIRYAEMITRVSADMSAAGTPGIAGILTLGSTAVRRWLRRGSGRNR